jgi:hypothetical protein
MATTLDVVGATPISITGSTGGQRVVPLSALQFNGSALQVKPAWANTFTADEITALVAVATARLATGELSKPPVPLPTPALVVTAAVAGPESNGIVVHLAPAPDPDTPPLSTPISIFVTETDSYPGLTTASEAIAAIGTDQAPAAGGPPLGTGLVQVQSSSINAAQGDAVPVDVDGKVPANGLKVKDKDGNVLFALIPRASFSPAKGLTARVKNDASGTSFTVTVSYDSTPETTSLPTFTIQSLSALHPAVGYLINLTAPATGAAVPAPTPATGITLTGGGPDLAARALLYTPTT